MDSSDTVGVNLCPNGVNDSLMDFSKKEKLVIRGRKLNEILQFRIFSKNLNRSISG